MSTISVAGVRSQASDYWDSVLEGWEPDSAHRLWRAHSDAVNIGLLRRWLPPRAERLLKTDLFDEAVGAGLYPELARHAGHVVGIDLSPAAVRAAARRYPGLDGQVADVLALPFATASFDVIVSNSTLDHFESTSTLCAALGELGGSLARGGQLIITLDNRTNPIVAVRTSRLFGPLHRIGVIPYYVGATYGCRGLAKVLAEAGFEVTAMTAIMHCPPQLAAHKTARAQRGNADSETERDHLRRVLRFEAMERWPTRHLTGHFVAASAIKL
jgi:SAM-dependent methyltransferase